MTTKQTVIAIIVTLLVGAAIGRYSLPAKVEVRTEVKTVEKIVKDTEKQKDTDKVITIVETKLPDGTVTKKTEIVDKSKTETTTKTTTDKDTDSMSESVTTYATKDWFVRGMAGFKLDGAAPTQYGIGIDRRILGPIHVGGYGFTDGKFGVEVGLSF